MPYWPLCRTSPPFPQNPSRRFLQEGDAATAGPQGSAYRGRTYRMHFCTLGTPLRRARLHKPRIYGGLTEALKQDQSVSLGKH